MFMKSMFWGAIASVSMMSHAADVERLVVRQQWPWSTDVKVECELSGVSPKSPVDLDIKVFNGDEEVSAARLKDAISGERYGIASGGVKTFYIDPLKVFGKSAETIPDFKVKVSLAESTIQNSQDVLYRILDLESNPVTYKDVRRADFYNGKYGDFVTDFSEIGKCVGSDDFTTSLDDVFIWTGVTNNPAYKTTKLVLRKIKANEQFFYMGADASADGKIPAQQSMSSSEKFRVKVSFTNDYWIGVFEVTEKQYALLTGADASSLSGEAACKPCVGIKYQDMRGDPSLWEKWPADIHEVTEGTILETIRRRLPGMIVDLPTEAQWEYASRAGTDTQLYCGRQIGGGATGHKNASESMAWNSDFTPLAEDGKRYVMAVGQLLPNAYGLYDTLGNAAELVRDIFDPKKPAPDSSGPTGPQPLTADVEEPMGWTDGAAAALEGNGCKGMYRGGCCYRAYTFSHSASRREWADLNKSAGAGSSYSGFRLWVKGE